MHTEVSAIRPLGSGTREHNQFYQNQTTLKLHLRWRQRLLRISLRHHVISPLNGFVQWFEDTNATEVERLQDDAIFYQGDVIGAKYSYVALEFINGFVCTCFFSTPDNTQIKILSIDINEFK